MPKRKIVKNGTDIAPMLPIMSGAVGGPSTGHGMAYQVDYAVWQALNLISDALCSYQKGLQIVIEPRAISETGITRWDIGLQPEDVNIEVKINPTRKDVEEWLDNIRKASTGSPHRSFKLVYSKGGNSLLNAVERLRGLAIECGEDANKFSDLAVREQIPDAEKVLTLLGEDAYLHLQRTSVDPFPETVLGKNIRLTARLLVGTEGEGHLYRLLYDKFSHGVAGRVAFAVTDLIDEAQQNKITFRQQPENAFSDYDPLILSTLFLLQACATGIPVEVITQAIDCDRNCLERVADTLIQDGQIIEDGDTWFIRPLTSELRHDYGDDILAHALDSLLYYIEHHKREEKAYAQVHNAIALARKCVAFRPRSVVPVFPVLDKLLKRTGDIQLVLEVAQLTIAAAKRVEPRTREEAEAVARALVCGVSWAYQRMPGHLDDARNAYVDSRDIAENIDDKVTLAFISKCLGRLCRMEAEQGDLGREERDAKLRESIQLLNDAVERFDSLQDYPLKTHEIADSYSLLGRTYLVAKSPSKVDEALRRAFAMMENLHSKEYADLLILNGDFEMSRGSFLAADSSYKQALDVQLGSGPDASEIRARVLRQRGKNFAAMKKVPEAKRDFQEAAEIWDKLGQHENAAAAQWEAISIEQQLPIQAVQMLDKEPSRVKLAMAELYSKRMAERGQATAHLSSREQPDKNFFERLLKEARQQTVIRDLNE